MQIGNFFILGFHGYRVPRWLTEFAKNFGLGGVILFDYYQQTKKYENNIASKDQVKELCAAIHELPSRPFVCIDQEGGKVRRLKADRGFLPFPSAWEFNKLTRSDRVKIAMDVFHELRELGIDWNLAPVVDMNINPENPDIGKVERSFSANANEIRENVRILADVARLHGIQLCLKHFPGIGGAIKNSHHNLMDLSEVYSVEQEDLFYELAEQIPAILVSHGIINKWEEDLPVSLSKYALARIRSRVPQALLVSDDIQMQGLQMKKNTETAASTMLEAGMDMVIIGNNMLNQEDHMLRLAENLLKKFNREEQANRRQSEKKIIDVKLQVQA